MRVPSQTFQTTWEVTVRPSSRINAVTSVRPKSRRSEPENKKTSVQSPEDIAADLQHLLDARIAFRHYGTGH
jgi:hypothetical protein